MKFRLPTYFIAMTLMAALSIPLRLAAQDQQQQRSDKSQHYTLMVLGALGNTFDSEAHGLNNRDSVAG